MELFAVMDKMILGKGVFGVFSTNENAVSFAEIFEEKTRNFCEIKILAVTGKIDYQKYVFAAHGYDILHDSYIFDGLYANLMDAFEAVGEHGLIIKVFIDVPEENQIIAQSFPVSI